MVVVVVEVEVVVDTVVEIVGIVVVEVDVVLTEVVGKLGLGLGRLGNVGQNIGVEFGFRVVVEVEADVGTVVEIGGIVVVEVDVVLNEVVGQNIGVGFGFRVVDRVVVVGLYRILKGFHRFCVGVDVGGQILTNLIILYDSHSKIKTFKIRPKFQTDNLSGL